MPADQGLSVLQRGALLLLRVYKAVFSPMYAGSCRFVPSCSDYAAEAVARFGVLVGSWLAFRRLARCHPLGGHGLDPVPHRGPQA
jgi:putative membrane protein insertion efficiency factor